MIIVGIYILAASVAPVWILLQPRDYLSSFLLYFMMIVAVVGIIGCGLTGGAQMDIPAFTGFRDTLAPTGTSLGYMFPALFVTIACGAISGFHSLVGSGTTAKQLNNEKDAQPIAYGGMLIECALAIISLCAVGYIWANYASGETVTPTVVFATGISKMLGTIPGLGGTEKIAYTLLVLTVSVFCLTSLDTATRLARYMFQEFYSGSRNRPWPYRLCKHLAFIRGCEPAPCGAGASGRRNLAWAGGEEQQDVPVPYGIHADCYDYVAVLYA